MDVKIVCTKCNHAAKSNENDDTSSAQKLPIICAECRLVFTSQYCNLNESSIQQMPKFELPPQSVYCHLNESILYPSNNVKHDAISSSSTSCSISSLNKYDDKCVLLIGCGGIKRLPVLKSLRSLKLKRLVCLSRQREWAFGYVDDWIIAEHENVNAVHMTRDAIRSYESTHNLKFDAVFTYDDYSVLLTSLLQNELGLLHSLIPYDFLTHIKNKYEFRRLCHSLDISHPRFFLIQYDNLSTYLSEYTSKEANSIVEIASSFANANCSQVSVEFPLILKNTYGSGKDYVKKCNSMSEFCESLHNLMLDGLHIDLVVEEFYEGHEIDMDILIQNNELKFIAISDNFPAIEPWFFEQGGIMPSFYLSRTETAAIEIIVSKWINKMNFQNALLHFEAKCKPRSMFNLFEQQNDLSHKETDVNAINENYLNFLVDNANLFLMPIEINPRLGGAEIWSLVMTVYNVNLINEYLNICLGYALDMDTLKRKQQQPIYQCVSKDLHPAINSRIASIAIGLNELMSCQKVIELNIFRSPNDQITYRDYCGFFTVILNKYAKCLDESEKKTIKPFVDAQENIMSLFQFTFE